MKRVIGFDPGFAIVGYGVLDYEDFRNIKVVDYGVITTPKEESFPVRLAIIYKGVQELIKKYNPDEVAVEELFFNTNITTGINVAHARGVLLLAAIHHCQKANSGNGQDLSVPCRRSQAGRRGGRVGGGSHPCADGRIYGKILHKVASCSVISTEKLRKKSATKW